MVNVTTENGKIILKDIVPMPDETAEKLKAVIKTNQKAVKAAMKDLGIDHWIETNGDKKFTIVSKKYVNENELDVIDEIKALRLAHHRFVEMLSGMTPQEPQPEENIGGEDEEAEKFLSYALVCKLQELMNSCSAIIIAIPK